MDKYKHLRILRTLSHFTMDTVLNGVIGQAFDRTIMTISHRNVTNDNLLNNTFIEKEAIDTFVSILSISKPSSIVGEINELKKLLTKEKDEAKIKYNKKLQILLEQYKKTKIK